MAVRGLTIGWGDVTLIEDISFSVARGEIFAILGGSGSGKSTLLRYLIGLETPAKGEIDVAGHGPPDLDAGLPPFGVMFQGGALFGSMTVLENVTLPLEEWTRLPIADIDLIARAKLRLVGLGGRSRQAARRDLRRDDQARGDRARAGPRSRPSSSSTSPAAGLDPVTALELDDLIVTLARSSDLAVLMVTHELEERLSRRGSVPLARQGDPERARAGRPAGPARQRRSSHPQVLRSRVRRKGAPVATRANYVKIGLFVVLGVRRDAGARGGAGGHADAPGSPSRSSPTSTSRWRDSTSARP